MAKILGTETYPDLGCPGHPKTEIHFPGDRCSVCKMLDERAEPRRFDWLGVLGVCLAAAVLLMGCLSAWATWLKLNG